MLAFETPSRSATTVIANCLSAVVANCLTRPPAVTLDKKNGSSLRQRIAGRIVAILIP